MKNIHLFTGNNAVLQELLVGLNCIPVPHELSDNGQPQAFEPFDIILYHVSDTSLKTAGQWIKINSACRQICITNEITPEQRNFFMKNGIAEVLCTSAPEQIIKYLDAVINYPETDKGSMLVFTAESSKKAMITAILFRFGYKAAFVNSCDAFFELIQNEEFHLFILDLSTDGLDLNAFVRSCHACKEIKKSPLITFRDMSDGIFINELTSGLNKFSSYVLSVEELLSFLVNILFRLELMPLIKHLNEISRFMQFSGWCGESVGKIYYTIKDNILNLPDILSDERLSEIFSAAGDISRSIAGVSAFNWIMKQQEYAPEFNLRNTT